jgi:hypothetical protein
MFRDKEMGVMKIMYEYKDLTDVFINCENITCDQQAE